MTEKAEIIKIIWVFSMLLIGSISDIRKKSVSVLFLSVTAVGCIAVSIPGFDAYLHFTGLLPGLFLLLISRISEDVIGDGDAYAVCFIGFTFGLYAAAAVLMITLLITAACAQLLIILKKAGRCSRIPLYPFLSIAFALRLMMITKGGN